MELLFYAGVGFLWMQVSALYVGVTRALNRRGLFFTLDQVRDVMLYAPPDMRARGYRARPCPDGMVRWYPRG